MSMLATLGVRDIRFGMMIGELAVAASSEADT